MNALLHHLTPELLKQSYQRLKKEATSGVDELTWKEYAEGLEDRISDLHERIHSGRYRAQPSKRIYLPKGDGGRRPIGIACLEDKIVQAGFVRILNEIYEVDFLGYSYGFRPGRSQHQALDALYVGVTKQKINWIVDADLRSFFDRISHDWLIRMLEQRIGDKRVMRLIRKWLRAGVSEAGKWSETPVGTPQGAVISPLLANVYLHYVLDLWVRQWRRKASRGEVIYVRYADDFVAGFQYREDAERFLSLLKQRLEKFDLEINEEKTRLIEFGRFAERDRRRRGQRKPETFDFLGLTHICSVSRGTGKYFILRRPSRKKVRQKLAEIYQHLQRIRHLPIPLQGQWLHSVFQGQLNYYAVPGSAESLATLRKALAKLWLKALRRRSQKGKRLRWDQFSKIADHWLPEVKIVHPYPWQRLRV
jgi:group II intron reverse transcriptase/maturase